MSGVQLLLSFIAAALAVLIPAAFVLMMPPVNQFNAARSAFILSALSILLVIPLGLLEAGTALTFIVVIELVGAVVAALLLKTSLGWVLQAEQKALEDKTPSRSPSSPLLTAQLEDITEIERFVGRKDEIALRRTFDFDRMLDLNVKARAMMIEPSLQRGGALAYLEGEFSSGVALLDPKRNDMSRNEDGVAVFSPHPGKIGELRLSDRYLEAREHLQSFVASARLPRDITDRVKDLAEAVERNVSALLDALNDINDENPRILVEAADGESPSHSKLNQRYNDRVQQLRPYADAISAAIRRHLRVM